MLELLMLQGMTEAGAKELIANAHFLLGFVVGFQCAVGFWSWFRVY